MEKILNKLERKFGRYAINNLSLYIIVAYAIGYVLTLTDSNGISSLDFITLNPYEICRFQVWRIITWIIVPPSQFSIFTIIVLYFYYQLGSILERTWGAFRYNIYIFSGIMFSVVGALVLYAISVSQGIEPYVAGYIVSKGFSTYYLNLSIFLAFAAIYPNIQVLLFFVIPVKMKWLGIIDGIMLLYYFLTGTMSVKFAIVMSMLNFILFFFGSRNFSRINPREIHRRNEFKRATSGRSYGGSSQSGHSAFSATKTPTAISKHKCAICGRTEKDNENLEFRFCSKCNGNYEYCSDHLFTHEHVK